MFDVWLGEIELTEVIVYLSVLAMIPLQLFLCFKVNNKVLRLLPAGILTLLIIIFMCMIQFANGWDGIGYAILAMFAGILLAGCIFAWVVFFVYKRKINSQINHL